MGLHDWIEDDCPATLWVIGGSTGTTRTSTDMSEPKFRRAVTLLEAEIGDEIVALDRQAGHCFGFNPVASDVWRMLVRPMTTSGLCSELCATYEVEPAQCREEVTSLLVQMIDLGLVDRLADEYGHESASLE